jgi:hypothetical protein
MLNDHPQDALAFISDVTALLLEGRRQSGALVAKLNEAFTCVNNALNSSTSEVIQKDEAESCNPTPQTSAK